MKVLYDGLIFNTQVAGGVNRYFANLIGRLPDDFSPALITYRIPTINRPQHRNLKMLRFRRFRPARVSRKLENLYFDSVAGPGKYDILHPTYYTPLTGRDWAIHGYPIVLTVYDMIHERFSDIMDPTGSHYEEKRKAIAAAQAIICISEHTKQDLIEYYSVPDSKITVTYLAAEISADLAGGPEAIPDRPYFLYVGSRAPYKNFLGLLQALSTIITAQSEIALCVVGPPISGDEHKIIADLGLTGIIHHYGYATDNHLAKLYQHSLAFVYPSLYEGFGIPPLEAMMCGTVVVASNTSSIPEVVGDGGILFDPESIKDLADILMAVSSGSINREMLIEQGHQRARQFSWDKTAAQTVEVYRSIIP